MIKNANLIMVVLVLLVTSAVATGAFAQEKIEIPSEVTLFKNVKAFNAAEDKRHDVDVLAVKNKAHKTAKDVPATGSIRLKVPLYGL